MKNIAENKSSYNKLYLIDSEMYNRILPHLNEVDKQELNDLNEKNRLVEDDQNDETFEQKNDYIEQKNEETEQKNEETEQENVNTEQINDDAIMNPTPKYEEPKIDESTIPVVEETSGMKMKKFACEICVNKKFTTKQSLKRHNKTFHHKKHTIKETEVYPEVIYEPISSNKTSPETGGKASFVDEPKSKNLKRKFQHNPGEFHLVRDNLKFSKDEPVIKLPKHGGFPDSKAPKRAAVKRKFDDHVDDIERYELSPLKKLKFNWESFSQ